VHNSSRPRGNGLPVSIRPENLRQFGLGRDKRLEVVRRRRGTDSIAQAYPV
jgi:hypothetical protein